jgi:hypothetical protein
MWIICTIGEWKETAGQVGIHPTRISHTNSTPAGAYLFFSPFRAAILCQHPLSSLFPFYKFAMFAYFFYLCRDICKIRIPVARTIIFYNNKQNYYYDEAIITLRLVPGGCHGSAGTGVDRSCCAG